MPIVRVHEFDVGRDGKARLSKVNPYRRWVGADLPYPIVWQNGRFMDDSGHELPLADVPERPRQAVAANVPAHTPEPEAAYLRICPVVVNGHICDRPVPSTEFEAHLVAHAQGGLGLDGATDADAREPVGDAPTRPPDPTPPPRPRGRPKRAHRPPHARRDASPVPASAGAPSEV